MPDRRRDDDEFSYLTDAPDRELADELRYAEANGLTELAKACRSEGKSRDFMPVYLGNIYGPTSDDE